MRILLWRSGWTLRHEWRGGLFGWVAAAAAMRRDAKR